MISRSKTERKDIKISDCVEVDCCEEQIATAWLQSKKRHSSFNAARKFSLPAFSFQGFGKLSRLIHNGLSRRDWPGRKNFQIACNCLCSALRKIGTGCPSISVLGVHQPETKMEVEPEVDGRGLMTSPGRRVSSGINEIRSFSTSRRPGLSREHWSFR